MRGKKEVIDVLNNALAAEIVAINQYTLHARMHRHRGFGVLAEQVEKESMDEMRHAQALIDRILFLDGAPDLRNIDPPRIGQTVPEQLRNDLDLERRAVQSLNDGIEIARRQGDEASAHLLGAILRDEESHVNWTETQLGLIEKLGEGPYLLGQLRSGEPGGGGAGTPAAPAAG